MSTDDEREYEGLLDAALKEAEKILPGGKVDSDKRIAEKTEQVEEVKKKKQLLAV